VRPCEFLEPATSTSKTISYREPPSRSLAPHAALGRNLVAQLSIVFSRRWLIELESVVSVVIALVVFSDISTAELRANVSLGDLA
jgi:hypothetical protein